MKFVHVIKLCVVKNLLNFSPNVLWRVLYVRNSGEVESSSENWELMSADNCEASQPRCQFNSVSQSVAARLRWRVVVWMSVVCASKRDQLMPTASLIATVRAVPTCNRARSRLHPTPKLHLLRFVVQHAVGYNKLYNKSATKRKNTASRATSTR